MIIIINKILDNGIENRYHIKRKNEIENWFQKEVISWKKGKQATLSLIN